MLNFGYLLPTRDIVQTSETATALTSKTQADVIDISKRAETLGFKSIWVGDNVLTEQRLEPLTTLSAVATTTDAVDVGTAVYLPTLRNPVHVAHMTATLDQLSGGRLLLGIGVGNGEAVKDEYENLDLPYKERGRMMDELLDVVTRLWEGEPVDYDGQFYQLEDASIGFSPASTPQIYIPSSAFGPSETFPRSIRNRLVKHGDGWLPARVSPDAYATALSSIRGFLEDAGRDPTALDTTVYLDVVIGDEAFAVEEARQFYNRYYLEWDTLSEEEVLDLGAFGPLDELTETLEAYDDAGVETMIVRFAATDQREQLRRFTDVAAIR